MALLPATLLQQSRTPARHQLPSSLEARWAALLDALSAQELTIAVHDQLEAAVIAKVQLPSSEERSVTESADSVGLVSIGEAAALVQRRLRARQAAWDEAARELDLARAIEAEGIAADLVKQAAADLITRPATELAHIRLKLATLLAVHEPGPVCRSSTPWRELRLILEDVVSLMHHSAQA